MSIKLLTEHHLEFLSLTGSYRGSSESTLVKMPSNIVALSRCIRVHQEELHTTIIAVVSISADFVIVFIPDNLT